MSARRLGDELACAALHSARAVQLRPRVEQALFESPICLPFGTEVRIQPQQHFLCVKRERRHIPRPGTQRGETLRTLHWRRTHDEDRCTSGSARPTAQLAAEFHEAITIVQAADDEDDVRSGTPRHLECLCSGGVHGAVASGLEHTPHRVGGPAFVADNERHPSEQ